MKFLFWNANQRPVDTAIVSLVADTASNIVALAEYGGDPLDLIRGLQMLGLNFDRLPTAACERLVVLTDIIPTRFRIIREAYNYVMYELSVPGKPSLLLVFVHLPSKLHYSENDQQHSVMWLRAAIEEAEDETVNRNTVVLGDFNMNPFEHGMIAAPAMHAMPCLKSVLRSPQRKVEGRSYSAFYNPCWNLLGDNNGLPGTFHGKGSPYASVFWNLLDQVVLRPQIANSLVRASLRILDCAGTIRLTNQLGRPSVSDHLPIAFELNL